MTKNTRFERMAGRRLPRKLQQERLHRALAALTPRQKQIVWEYYCNQKRIPQIARELGVNKSTVCRTLRRAERHLQEIFSYSV